MNSALYGLRTANVARTEYLWNKSAGEVVLIVVSIVNNTKRVPGCLFGQTTNEINFTFILSSQSSLCEQFSLEVHHLDQKRRVH